MDYPTCAPGSNGTRYRMECYLGRRVPGNDTTNLEVLILTDRGVIANRWPYRESASRGFESALSTAHLFSTGADSRLGRALPRKPMGSYGPGDLMLILKRYTTDPDGSTMIEETAVETRIERIEPVSTARR